jgi:hypothetical protein
MCCVSVVGSGLLWVRVRLMRRHGRRREFPPQLAEFREADWLAAPPTDDEAALFGDVAYWLTDPEAAGRLRWSLAQHRWGEARLAFADEHFGVQGWAGVLVETLGTPLYTRPVA